MLRRAGVFDQMGDQWVDWHFRKRKAGGAYRGDLCSARRGASEESIEGEGETHSFYLGEKKTSFYLSWRGDPTSRLIFENLYAARKEG